MVETDTKLQGFLENSSSAPSLTPAVAWHQVFTGFELLREGAGAAPHPGLPHVPLTSCPGTSCCVALAFTNVHLGTAWDHPWPIEDMNLWINASPPLIPKWAVLRCFSQSPLEIPKEWSTHFPGGRCLSNASLYLLAFSSSLFSSQEDLTPSLGSSLTE